MAKLDRAEADAFRQAARRMFFSNASVERFLEAATPTQLSGALGLVGGELALREEAKVGRLMRKAGFPYLKSLEGFDWADVALPEGYPRADMEGLGFVDRAEDFVFFGKSGRGKTHLAVALGVRCASSGRRVRFFDTAALVDSLTRAAAEGKVEALLADVARADLVVPDEFGYIPLNVDGGRLLFRVISQCYETRSLIVTTNLEFGHWGGVFSDDKLAAAAVDRLVHHGRLVEFGGRSRRMDGSLMLSGERG